MLRIVKRRVPDSRCRIDVWISMKTENDHPDTDNIIDIRIGKLLIGKGISTLILPSDSGGLKNYGYYSFAHDDYGHWHLRYLPPDYCLTDKGIDMEKLEDVSEAFPVESINSVFQFQIIVADKGGEFVESLKEIFSIKNNYIGLENVGFGICHTNNSHTIRIDFGKSYRKSLKDEN